MEGLTRISIQVEVFSILLITGLIFVLLFWFNHTLRHTNPLDKPKGFVLLGILYYEFIDRLTSDNMGKKAAQKYSPYIAALTLFLVISNLSSLTGLAQPTANYSVTLTLTLITFSAIQYTKIKANGMVGYVKGFFEPYAVFFIMNFFGLFAPLLSMSLRLFGNMTSGSTLMMLLYRFTEYVTSLIPFIGPSIAQTNVLGIVLAPFLHFYFDVFSGLIQAYIFIMLTTIFIGNEMSQE